MSATTKKLTAEEFLALDLDEDVYHHELHDGEIVVVNPPKPRHSTLQTVLNQLFGYYQLRHGEFRSIVEPGLKLFSDEVCRPDLIVLLEPDRGGRCMEEESCFSGPPEIVVEVLSSKPVQDLVKNRDLYARAQIPEYWILSPEENAAVFLRLEAGSYREAAILREGYFESPLLPGFRLDVAALFQRDIYTLATALTQQEGG
jgi:Uma2 family endonuclease